MNSRRFFQYSRLFTLFTIFFISLLSAHSLDVPRPKAESPLYTPTPQPTPVMQQFGEYIVTEMQEFFSPPLIGFHPSTGQYVYKWRNSAFPGNAGYTEIFILDSHPLEDHGFWYWPVESSHHFRLDTSDQLLDWTMTASNRFYMSTKSNGILYVDPGENEPVLLKNMHAQRIWLVSENAKIKGAKPGDLLVAHRSPGKTGLPDMISILSPNGETPTLTPLLQPEGSTRDGIYDLCEGPDGDLFLLSHFTDNMLFRDIFVNITKITSYDIPYGTSNEYISPLLDTVNEIVYNANDQSFYITSLGESTLRLFRFSEGKAIIEQIAEFVDTDPTLSVSPNGDLLVGNKFRLRKNPAYIAPTVTPTAIPTSTRTPRLTRTPTATATPTPRPFTNVSSGYEASYWNAPEVATENGEELEFWGKVPGREDYLFVLIPDYWSSSPVFKFYLVHPSNLKEPVPDEPAYSINLRYRQTLESKVWMIDENNRLYVTSSATLNTWVVEPLPSQAVYALNMRSAEILPVGESSRFMNCEPGDAVVLKETYTLKNSFYRISIRPDQETPNASPLVESAISPTPDTSYYSSRHGISTFPDLEIVDALEGPGGKLYVLSRDPAKILRLDDDGQAVEVTHSIIDQYAFAFVYSKDEHCFYVVVGSNPYRLLRIDENGNNIQLIANMPKNIQDYNYSWLRWRLEYWEDGALLVGRSFVLTRNDTLDFTPTPTPPVPTPRSVKDWLVLDGFGGIHTTNPDTPRPALPYIPTYNIMRDLEPDPLGRGWYMLDGWGGIHASSPDMPIPRDLPYFWGYDIARNLEVKNTPDGLMFYMLDGFGVIHTNDPDFDYGNLPWFGEDRFVDLEPEPNGDGWMVMDESSMIYFSNRVEPDKAVFVNRLVPVNYISSFVRFADETTVMIDLWGGRHTNFYYPAANVLDGLSPDFYFPGWDIAWDIEPIYAE